MNKRRKLDLGDIVDRVRARWTAHPVATVAGAVAVTVVAAGAAWGSGTRTDRATVDHVAWLPGVTGVDQVGAWIRDGFTPGVVPPVALVDLATLARRRGLSSAPTATVANRNHNPLNIKYGLVTRGYVEAGRATLSPISPLDGGQFLRFDSPSTGFRAAADLLRARPYEGRPLADVFRRWSNNGFGAEILDGTPLHGGLTVADLTVDELALVLGAMASAEGYRSPRIAAEIATALASAAQAAPARR